MECWSNGVKLIADFGLQNADLIKGFLIEFCKPKFKSEIYNLISKIVMLHHSSFSFPGLGSPR